MLVNKSASAACVTATLLAIGSGVLADDYYTSVPGLPTVSVGPDGTGATPVDMVFGKEYSNIFDTTADGTGDQGQNVSWDGLAGPIGGDSGSVDAFDYYGDDVGGFEVDAIANRSDFLVTQILNGTATLLFSTEGDFTERVHWSSPTAGDHGTWAELEASGAGVNHHIARDVDGLEVWGPEPPSHTIGGGPIGVEGVIGGVTPTADADRYSRNNDFNEGASVFAFDYMSSLSTPYISWITISEAVDELFLPGSATPADTIGSISRQLIDVDALMVRDFGELGVWDAGDEILFSIRPIQSLNDDSGAPLPFSISGGEIMHLQNLGAGLLIEFLTHGGVTFDNNLDLITTFGVGTNNIDGLEAVGVLEGGDMDIPTVPEPASVALLGVGVLMMMRRRREA